MAIYCPANGIQQREQRLSLNPFLVTTIRIRWFCWVGSELTWQPHLVQVDFNAVTALTNLPRQIRGTPARQRQVAGSSHAQALTWTTRSGGKSPGTTRTRAFF